MGIANHGGINNTIIWYVLSFIYKNMRVIYQFLHDAGRTFWERLMFIYNSPNSSPWKSSGQGR